MENVAELGDLLTKAKLTRADALKDLANVTEKLRQQAKELTQNPALKRMEQAARTRGYSVAFVGLTSTDRLAVEDAIQRLRLQTVAGIVAVSPQAAMAEAVRHVSIEIPTVAIWGHPGPTIPTVSSAETAGARLATTHLIDLGHRNMVFSPTSIVLALAMARAGAKGELRRCRNHEASAEYGRPVGRSCACKRRRKAAGCAPSQGRNAGRRQVEHPTSQRLRLQERADSSSDASARCRSGHGRARASADESIRQWPD
jgi:hypothetical protein